MSGRSTARGTAGLLGLTAREWGNLSAAVSKKLDANVARIFKDQDDKLKQSTEEHDDAAKTFRSQLLESENALKTMERQLQGVNAALADSHATVKSLETESEDLRRQRNSITEQRSHLQLTVDRQSNEIRNLTAEVAQLSAQLKNAVDGRCQALSNTDEMQDKASFLEQRDRHMEKERLLLHDQIRNLTDDVNRYTVEMQTVKSEHDKKMSALVSQLNEKTDRLASAEDTVERLTKLTERISTEKNNLSKRLSTYSEAEDDALENFKRELDAKTKLTDMYSDMLNESNAKLVCLQARLDELQNSDTSLMSEKSVLLKANEQLKMEYEAFRNENEVLVASLKSELEKANAYLKASKEECLSLLLEDMSPSASATCNLIKTMSLTQVYNQIVKLSDELSETKSRNEKLNFKIKNVEEKYEDGQRKLTELTINYEDAVKNNVIFKNRLDELSIKCTEIDNDKLDLAKINNQLKSENHQLKNDVKDLSRQICILLDKIQGNSNTESLSTMTHKPLVTFESIEELQQNNIRLSKLIGELREKLKHPRETNVQTDDTKNADFNKRIFDLMETHNHQVKIIEALTAQRDRFEKLYTETLESVNKSNNNKVEAPKTEVTTDKKLMELQKTLEKQSEDHKKYKEEMQINERILSTQVDELKKKLSDLSLEYTKIVSESKVNAGLYESLKANIETYRKQIASLEERNRIYDASILKQEETIKYLRDEAMTSLTKLSRNKIALENMQQEYKFLKDSENRLKKERDLLKKERFSQSLIMNDIKLMVVSDERRGGEEKIGFEAKLNVANKEILELKKQLQSQEDKFNEMKSNLERQLSQSEMFLKESRVINETKKDQLVTLNQQLNDKTSTIDDLNKRLLNLISMSSQENAPDATKKIKDLESQLNACRAQIDGLQHQLSESKEYGKSYLDKYNELIGAHEECQKLLAEQKIVFEDKCKDMITVENELKEKISNLEMKLSFQSRDLNLLDSNELKVELSKTIVTVESLSKDLEDKREELKLIKSNNEMLTKMAQDAEEKFRHEMMLHSADVQALSTLKKEHNELKMENVRLSTLCARIESDLKRLNEALNQKEKEIKNEKQEMQSLIANVKMQNALLHDQLQSINNQSFDNQSIEKQNLLTVIKQLKNENSLYMTKFESVQAEKDRIYSELNIVRKKLDDVKNSLDDQTDIGETKVLVDDARTNIVKDIDKFNALTDSNIILRHERDGLVKRVSQLEDLSANCESMLKVARSDNEQLKARFDTTHTENVNLKAEITRWKTRVNSLVEKANKQSPEDWKRLQNERETLAKMLTVEKDNGKRLLDEITALRMSKADTEEQIGSMNLKLASLTEGCQKQTAEIATMKADMSRITKELTAAKTSLDESQQANAKLNETLTNKEAAFAQATKREGQLRTIANKYRTQYTELLKTVEQNQPDLVADSEEQNMLNDLKEQCDELQRELNTLRENMADVDAINLELTAAKDNVEELTEANRKLTEDLARALSRIDDCEKSKADVESQLTELKAKHEEQLLSQSKLKNHEVLQLNRRIEYLLNKINQIQKTTTTSSSSSSSSTQSPKPSTSRENVSVNENVMEAQFPSVSSDISSSASSSRATVENFPTSSSTSHPKSSQLPPESTQDVESENTDKTSSQKNVTVSTESSAAKLHSHQAASSSSNNSNSNSTVTTSHRNENVETQRTIKRPRHSADQTDEQSTSKRSKVHTPAECELDYQVSTSSQRDQEDDCVILLDSGDEDNQCENSYQAEEDMEDEEEEKVAQSNVQMGEGLEKAVPTPAENNEVDVVDDQSPPANPQSQRGDDNAGNSNEANTEQSPPAASHNTEQQIETISSVTEGGNGYLSLGVDEASDSIVPSTPVLHVPRRTDGFGEAISSPATSESTSARDGCFTFTENRTQPTAVAIEDTHPDLASQIAPHALSAQAEPLVVAETEEDPRVQESSEAEAEDSQQNEGSSTVSSQSATEAAAAASPQMAEESSEAEASSTNFGSPMRGGFRRGQSPRINNFNRSEYQLRQSSQRARYNQARRPYRR